MNTSLVTDNIAIVAVVLIAVVASAGAFSAFDFSDRDTGIEDCETDVVNGEYYATDCSAWTDADSINPSTGEYHFDYDPERLGGNMDFQELTRHTQWQPMWTEAYLEHELEHSYSTTAVCIEDRNDIYPFDMEICSTQDAVQAVESSYSEFYGSSISESYLRDSQEAAFLADSWIPALEAVAERSECSATFHYEDENGVTDTIHLDGEVQFNSGSTRQHQPICTVDMPSEVYSMDGSTVSVDFVFRDNFSEPVEEETEEEETTEESEEESETEPVNDEDETGSDDGFDNWLDQKSYEILQFLMFWR